MVLHKVPNCGLEYWTRTFKNALPIEGWEKFVGLMCDKCPFLTKQNQQVPKTIEIHEKPCSSMVITWIVFNQKKHNEREISFIKMRKEVWGSHYPFQGCLAVWMFLKQANIYIAYLIFNDSSFLRGLSPE